MILLDYSAAFSIIVHGIFSDDLVERGIDIITYNDFGSESKASEVIPGDSLSYPSKILVLLSDAIWFLGNFPRENPVYNHI